MSIDGSSLQITAPGYVVLARRGEAQGDDNFVRNQLVARHTPVVLLAEYDAEEDGGYNVQLAALDVGNQDTGEAYSATLSLDLSWDDVVNLRDFLSYLLSLRPGEDTA